MARRVRWLAALLLVAGLAVAGWRWLPPRTQGQDSAAAGPAAATATVERADLSTTRTVSGELGFGPARPVRGGDGTATWLPKTGAVIGRGQTLYRRDDRPVPLLYGSTPLFRALDTVNLVGRDVRVLVDNLRALGYRTGDQPPVGRMITPGRAVDAAPPDAAAPREATAQPDATAEPDADAKSGAAAQRGAMATPVEVRPGDGVLTRAVVSAVKRWQGDYGVPATGVVSPGDVVVQKGKLRVDALSAEPGSPASEALMSVTGTAKVVTVDLDAGDAGSARRGAAVRVNLPDGEAAKAKITGVGTVARTPESGESDRARITVTVTLDDPKRADRLDAAPVQVDLLGETHQDVLTVPVEALLAVLEGGYAVQLAGGALTPVDTGLFAGGRVEISGPGIDEGVTVVTAS
jgi:hypothetical protein